MQAESMAYAYSVWRRKWGGRGKEYVSIVPSFICLLEIIRLTDFRRTRLAIQRLLACYFMGYCRLLLETQACVLYHRSSVGSSCFGD